MKNQSYCWCLITFLLGFSAFHYSRAQTLPPALNDAILNTKQGNIVELPGFLNEDIPAINYEQVVMPGPQFIISDEPEYIRVPEAIALQESVQPGTVRLYIYNVNGVEKPQKMERKITAVIKNIGDEKLHFTMLKYSSQTPGTNYYKIGKEGLADYFASKTETKVRTLKPGEAMAIDEQLEKHVVRYNELVHGIYEFLIDQPAEITILQTSPEKSGAEAIEDEAIEILPPKTVSGAGRGLFGVSNYMVKSKDVIDTEDGARQIIVADGVKDPWIEGYEGTTGKHAEVAGNYGVMYDIEVDWKSTDGKGLALVTWNARAGGKWCGGMATSMVVSPGKFEAGVIQLPSNQLVTKAAPEAILVQVFTPDPNKAIQTLKLRYSPPGASCLPTPLIFIPVDLE